MTVALSARKALTVMLVKDTGHELADIDIEAVLGGSQVLKVGVSELYFQQLRLRVTKDPTLLEKIAVLYQDGSGKIYEVGLTFEDENEWPSEFLREAIDIEIEISKLRYPSLRGGE